VILPLHHTGVSFIINLINKRRKMKKAGYVFLLGVLLTFIGTGAWADTIDKLSLAGNILAITGTYSDGCSRDPVILQTPEKDEVLVQIFTVIPAAGTACPPVVTPYTLTVPINPPEAERYRIEVLLYKGTPRVDDTVALQASKAINNKNKGNATDASVHITPDTININRKGLFITARIKPPQSYKAADIDLKSIHLCLDTNIATAEGADDINEAISDFEVFSALASLASDTTSMVCGEFAPQKVSVQESHNSVIAVFSSQDVIDLINNNIDITKIPATVPFGVQWKLTTDSTTIYEATDEVKVVNNSKHVGKGNGNGKGKGQGNK
jgi:hypothetical protein